MSRSRIGIEYPDGSVTSVYCHSDGYPDFVGRTLTEGYPRLEKAEELLGLGDLSYIEESIGTCRAYHRDCGEAWEHTRPETHDSAEEYLALLADVYIRYVYLFRDGFWHYASEEAGSWSRLDGGGVGTTGLPTADDATRVKDLLGQAGAITDRVPASTFDAVRKYYASHGYRLQSFVLADDESYDRIFEAMFVR